MERKKESEEEEGCLEKPRNVTVFGGQTAAAPRAAAKEEAPPAVSLSQQRSKSTEHSDEWKWKVQSKKQRESTNLPLIQGKGHDHFVLRSASKMIDEDVK